MALAAERTLGAGVRSAALVGFFTRIPLGRSASIEDVASVFPFVPLVGWLTGGAGALAAVLLWPVLPAEALAAVVLALIVGVTGLNQTDGLLDVGDGLMAHGEAGHRLEVMRDHAVGAGGVGLGVFTYLIAYGSLVGLARVGEGIGAGGPAGNSSAGVGPAATLAAAVVLAEVGARVPYLILARWGRPSHPGLGELFLRGFGGRELVLGIITVLPVTALGLLLGAAPVAAGLGAATVTGFVLVHIAGRRFGGVGGDVLGASQELSRSAVLLAVAAILSAG